MSELEIGLVDGNELTFNQSFLANTNTKQIY